MSLSLYRRVILEIGPSLTDSEYRVLTVLVAHANHDGEAWPSVGRLVKESGRCDRSVRMALAGLRKRGLIQPVGFASRKGVKRYSLASLIPSTPAEDSVNDCPF